MKPMLKNVFKSIGHTVSKYSPEILIGIGIGGICVSTISTIIATKKALNAIDDEIDRQNEENIQLAENADEIPERVTSLSRKDVVRVTWKYYVPTAVMLGTSIACMVGANQINHKRNVLLAASYEIASTALDEYKDVIVEEFGEEKATEIDDKVVKKRVERQRQEVEYDEIIETGKGDTLYYDETSARYFRSNKESIREAINNLNFRMLKCENYVSLNDFYDEIGIRRTSKGDDSGWSADRGWIEIRLSSQLGPKDEPCGVIIFRSEPRPDYRW